MLVRERLTRQAILAVVLLLSVVALQSLLHAAEPGRTAQSAAELFRRDHLIAWCIVPFDSQKRGPAERAEMLRRLGFKHYAYDWRAEHLLTFETEIAELKKRDIELSAVWFPGSLNREAKLILDALKRHQIKTELWVTGGGAPVQDEQEQQARVASEVARIRPIAEAAAAIGCQVGLYNHGGWFGEPENQLAIIEQLKMPNVGIVYNLHHGHDQLDRLPDVLHMMLPKLLAVNLNGMVAGGDKIGKKILPLAQGDDDLRILRTICDSGYRGPIGILGHTQDDAEARLRDNLDGLDWLVNQLNGRPPGPKPRPRTMQPNKTSGPAKSIPGYIVAGREEYRRPPISVECRATLRSKQGYNILVASDTKQSTAHWELFSMPRSGYLAAYLPGMQPDHVTAEVNIADDRRHVVAMLYEPTRVRLLIDGKIAADAPVERKRTAPVAGDLAFGRLVEGGIGCDGSLDYVHIRRGIHAEQAKSPLVADADTLGLWQFTTAGSKEVLDLSPVKNHARLVAAAVSKDAPPPPGPQLSSTDPRLKVVLLDRSPDESYLAVKVDSEGCVFVGGREALFVFEPDEEGYRPKRELLRFPADSIIMGLEFRGNDLFVLTANALYRVPEGRTRRENLRPERLLWGLPLDLHVSFHCLAWGPQGDLYLDHGDPLLGYGDWNRPDHWGHWTLFAGTAATPVPYTGQGCVMRVHPDGTEPRVVAGGLRGPVGLAFDRDWNLFTNDNDHESRADLYAPARLLHVTPQVDFSWPRGWLASKSPDRRDLLETLTPALGRGVPCDLAYYDEPLFSDQLPGRLLMCRWDRSAVTSYPLKPRGASFATEEQVFLTGVNNARPVGVAVGRGGRLFVTVLYMTGNMASPYCASDLVMVTPADTSAKATFEPYDVTELSVEQLWLELSSDSWQRRCVAHQEILRRGQPLLNDAVKRLAAVQDTDPAIEHLPWLAAASGSRQAARILERFATHKNVEVRLQALGSLGEMPASLVSEKPFVAALADPEPRVQLAALAPFFNAAHPLPESEVVRLARSDDTYLRQTATTLLAARASTAELEGLVTSTDERTRLAGVLAIGRKLTVPGAADKPDEKVPLFCPKENSFFKPKLHFFGKDDEIDLTSLGRIGSYTIAERWATLPHSAEEERLFSLLTRALDDPSDVVPLQAAYWLSLLHDSRTNDLIAKVQSSVVVRRLEREPQQPIGKAWQVGPFEDGSSASLAVHPPQQGAIDLTATYATSSGSRAWHEVGAVKDRFDLSSSMPRPQSYYLQFQIQSGSRQPALIEIEAPGSAQVWQNGSPVKSIGEGSGIKAALLDLQPGTNEMLVRTSSDDPATTCSIGVRAAEKLVLSVAEKLGTAELTQRLREAARSGSGQAVPAEFISVDWSKEALAGDAAAGRRLFGSLACAKCHAINLGQKGGGAPNLSDARRRFTIPHVVESILLPSKQVAEPLRATTIATSEGQVITGLITSESADELEILASDATRRTIRKSQIEERSSSMLSPMPQGLVKTPRELRDLLAYLLSENPLPP
jgi:putative heme-binding domain-containing protein